MTSETDISVIVCCYNSEARILPTLEHLKAQQFDGKWELLLVDNNSSDRTVEIAEAFWQKAGQPVPLEIVKEKRPGLSHARKAGVETSTGKYLVFCDDDNWLYPRYLSVVKNILDHHPDIGVAGGQTSEVLEGDPPDWWEDKKLGFAVGKQAPYSGDITDRGYIWGAGMVIRQKILRRLYHAGFSSMLLGRTGKQITSGDDSEICKWVILMGYKLYYDERLKLQHFISKDRLTDEYCQKLYAGHSNARKILAYYNYVIKYTTSLKGKTPAQAIYIKIIYLIKAIKTGSSIKVALQLLIGRSVIIHEGIYKIMHIIELLLKEKDKV